MAVDVISVKAEYDGSAEGAKQAAKEAATAVDRMADQVAAASRKVEAASGRMDAFSLGMAKLAAQSKATYGPMDKLGDEVKQTGEQADNAAPKMKGLGEQVEKTGDKAKKAKASLGEIGSALTTHLTLPLTLAGGAAVKFATDVETNFAHVEGLVGITGDALDTLKAKTMALAGAETGQGIRALSDGLYFITSSGLKGQQAIDALDASAKAATAGLGSVGQVADAVTSAVNAYTGSNLSAAEATDILTNIVKEGKVEADQLAGSIGAVIPIASTAGVSFDQVGAAVAILSRNGASAGEAVTQVRSAIDSIIKPSVQAKTELANVGLTTDQLKQSLSEKGLLATMRLLRDRFGENTEGLGKFTGRIEAMNAILAITNGDAKETDRVFQSLKNSAGLTDAAFEAASKTAAVKMRNALNDVETAGVNLGAAIIPVIGGVAGIVGDAASKFGEMDKSSQNTVVAVGGVVAAAGPTIKAIDGITKAIGNMSVASAGIGAIVGGAAIIATKLWLDHKDAVARVEEEQKRYIDVLREIKDPSQVASDTVHDLTTKFLEQRAALTQTTPELDAVARGVRAVVGDDVAKQFEDLGISMGTLYEGTKNGSDVFDDVFKKMKYNLSENKREIRNYDEAIRGATPAQKALTDQIIATWQAGLISYPQMMDMVAGLDKLTDRADDAREAQAKRAKVDAVAAVESGVVTQALIDQTLAMYGSKESVAGWLKVAELIGPKMAAAQEGFKIVGEGRQLVKDFTETAFGLGDAVEHANDAANEAPGAYKKAHDAFQLTEEAADKAREAIEKMQTALLETFDAEGGQREAAVKLAEAHQKLFDKTKAVDEATRVYGAGSTEAATADYERTRALDDVEAAVRAKADADVNAATKQAESTGVTISAKDQNYIYRDSLVATRDATGDPQLIAYIDQLIQRLDLERLRAEATADALAHRNRELFESTYGTEGQHATRDLSGAAVVRRAGGGDLFSGQLALVGEEGPELFMPKTAGTVLDASKTAMALQSASSYPVIRNAQDLLAVQASGRRINEDMFAEGVMAQGGFGGGVVRFADGTVAPLNVASSVAQALLRESLEATKRAAGKAKEQLAKLAETKPDPAAPFVTPKEWVPGIVAAITAAGGTVSQSWLATYGLATLSDNQYGSGLKMPTGGFSAKPANGGKINSTYTFPRPPIQADISGLTQPMGAVGPMGRFGPYTFPSEATPKVMNSTVNVTVQVDGWANADPRQIGKAAYQALVEESRRRGNATLRNILVGI